MADLSVVDLAERERIREGLKLYKKQHGGIGDPELRERIENVLKLSPSLVTQSTLQRFIKGSRRTEDVVVRRYRAFLQRVAPPPPDDELARIWRDFLPGTPSVPIPPGTYHGYVKLKVGRAKVKPEKSLSPLAAAAKGRWPTAKAEMDGFVRTNSMFSMKQARGGHLRVRETFSPSIFSSDKDTPSMEIGGCGSTGVLVPCGERRAMMMMRSYLGFRFYVLSRVSDKPFALRGSVYEPAEGFGSMKTKPDDSWQPEFEVALEQSAFAQIELTNET